MADLIDRNALIAEYDRYKIDNLYKAIIMLNNAPRVDAEPVRYAHWIEDEYGYMHCSECSFEHDSPEYVTQFCPMCGAKMSEKVGE